MGRLDNKVALITGAQGGMGHADALLMVKEGAKVIATDIDQAKLDEVYAGIDNVLPLKLDVSNEADWENAVKVGVERFGTINVLVNNAGIHIPKNVLEFTVEEYNKEVSIDMLGVSLGMKHVIPVMQENGGGSIINISSIAGLLGGEGADGGGHVYSAAKGGVRSMTKNVAIEFAKDNIRANSLHPGTVYTPIMETHGITFENAKEIYSENIPLPPHIGEPDDIAYGVVYLASDESKFITGQELVIDGGYSAK